MYISWTPENLGRMFIACPRGKDRMCHFRSWIYPEMCERSKKIIPGLLHRLNEQEERIWEQEKMIAGAGASDSINELVCQQVEQGIANDELKKLLQKAHAKIEDLLVSTQISNNAVKAMWVT